MTPSPPGSTAAMGLRRESHEVELAASPEEVFEVLTDYERLLEWQGPLKECRVLSRDAEGRGREVEYVVDAKVREVRYRLAHCYQPPHTIGSSYLGGDFAAMEGEWELRAAAGGGTRARLMMAIDPGLPVPGRIARKVNERVLKRSVEDLASRVGAAD